VVRPPCGPPRIGYPLATRHYLVHQYSQTPALDKDLRLKILQVVDETGRTVLIRRKLPE